MKHNLLTTFFLLFILNISFGQEPDLSYLNYVFPSDSLSGFNETAENARILAGGFFGKEYKVVMYKTKRDFITNKYGYSHGDPFATITSKGSLPTIMGVPCNNEDFELSASSTSTVVGVGSVGNTLVGWTVTQGQNSGLNSSCTMAGCCPTLGTTNAWVRSTPWTDPNAGVLGVIAASPLGGTKILQMNDNIPVTGEMVKISQTFPVTATNDLFQLAFLASLDGSGHACCDQPFMTLKVLSCLNVPLACPQVSITAPGPSCVSAIPTGWATNALGISYTTGWRQVSMDLSPYIGSCVTVEFLVSDCNGWAHHGMCYVDFLCSPLNITVNNIPFPASSNIVAVTACGVLTATMCASAGMAPYLWNGPAGSGVTNLTTQCITTTKPGNYTLTMTPPGACAPITKTLTLTFGTFPAGGFTVAKACGSLTITNTGAVSPAVQTYTIIGPGGPPTYTTTAPSNVVILNASTTYTIYQTITLGGCPTTTSLVTTMPAGPNPAFTAASSFTQCFNGNSFVFTAVTAAGTHTYNFNPTVGAPANSTTNPYGPVVFTATGTYTVTHTIASGTCVASTSSIVLINQTPTITAATGTTPGCAGGTATLVGGGGPGSVIWTGPSSYTSVGSGTTSINNFQPANTGIYTITVNNNGCIATKTVNMGLPGVPTATVTNTGPYCQGATIIMNANVSTTVGVIQTQFSSPWCCWSTCCTGYSAAVTPTATTSSSGVYYFNVWYASGCSVQVTTTITVNPCFLPIELTSFDASCVNNAIDLKWQTATEINNESFSILRSEDDINFEMIGLIPGSGNSNSAKNYSYTDKQRVVPGRTYYYRLRQTDFSKAETDAGKIVYAFCAKKNYILEVFPNPASTEVCLISENDLNNVTIEMVNTLGEKVKVINNVNLAKNQKFTIDVRDVTNGAYHIIVSGNETLIQKKVVTYK